jgi:hypothetical protein
MIEHLISRQGSARRLGRVAMRGILAMMLFLQTSASPAAKKEEPAPDERAITAFIEKWRCPVAAYLRRIHQLPRTNDDRYLILWAKRRPTLYVQCIFHDDDRQIYCEAVRLDALAGLGFSTDGSGIGA